MSKPEWLKYFNVYWKSQDTIWVPYKDAKKEIEKRDKEIKKLQKDINTVLEGYYYMGY